VKLNILFLTLDDIMVLEFIGYSLEESLKDASIGILEARYEKDALEILESQKVSLIIADMNINTLESYEFYDKLQLDNKYKNIPFVFLSANEDDQDIAILKGISNFFLKPLDVDQLLETLHNILKNTKSSSQQPENNLFHYALDDDKIHDQKFYLDNILDSAEKINALIDENQSIKKREIKKLTQNIKEQLTKLSENEMSPQYNF